jgi:CcmD family protein
MADSNEFVVAAYVVMWAGLAGYAWHLILTTRRAKARLEQVSGGGEAQRP